MKQKILLMALLIGGLIGFSACNGDEDCPNNTFSTLAECEDATDGMKCICVQDGNEWKAILNP